MKIVKQKVIDYLLSKDEWIFIGIILVYSLVYTQSTLWQEYLGLVARYSVELLPLLAFKFFQPQLLEVLNKKIRIALWLVVFVLYPLLIIFIDLEPPRTHYFQSSEGDILLSFFIIEVLLLFNSSLKAFTPIKTRIDKLGLDRIVLIVLAIFSVYFSLLATSNLDLWAEKNQIRHPVQFLLVLQNFPSFISLALQVFCLYFSGFILFWINRHILIKKVLAERGSLVYLLSAITTVVLLYPILTQAFLYLPINSMGEPIIPAEAADPFSWDNGRVASAIMAVSLPIILFVNWHKRNNQFIALEKEKSETELELLKQQINPHFFFNTLNNLYALCLKKSEKAPEVVLQLSELMRYVVYQGKEDFVPVKDEIKYIEDYISLQSIRLHKSLELDIDMQLEDKSATIAPLLMVILIENAFKHGIEPATEACFLSIKLIVRQSKLTFICQNSVEKDEIVNETKENKSTGIGLVNLQRRLSLLYPNKHQLDLDLQSKSYTAELTIDLSKEPK